MYVLDKPQVFVSHDVIFYGHIPLKNSPSSKSHQSLFPSISFPSFDDFDLLPRKQPNSSEYSYSNLGSSSSLLDLYN